MFNRIAEIITGALSDMAIFRKVDLWIGDSDTLLNQPRPLPSAYVALASGAYSASRTIPDTSARLNMKWDVLLFFNAISDSRLSAPTGYGILEAVSAPASSGGLSGLKVDDIGSLWPDALELVLARNGVCIYGISFYIDGQCQ